jgi:hypothetical protein
MDRKRRSIHNEELYAPHFSRNTIRVTKSRRLRWAGHLARVEEEKCIQVLLRTSEGKRQLERTRRRWKNNIKMDLQEVRWGGIDGIDLEQNRDRWRSLVNAVTKLRIP